MLVQRLHMLMPQYVNLASDKLGSKVIEGKSYPDDTSQLLNDDITNYSDIGYTYHKLTTDGSEGITVELGSPSHINHIKLLIYDDQYKDSYKYVVEVSVDRCKWDRVIDHTKYFCRSWQFLYFPLREVRYIRFIGRKFGVFPVFALVSLKAFRIPEIPTLFKGFVWPTHNVATVDRGAIVWSAENREGLLNETSMMSSADSERIGFTSSRLVDGEIGIQFGQPYYVDSIRLLQWDSENRSYRFYVQTSVDEEQWEMAVDMRDMDLTLASSESVFKFAPRLVVFVKIIRIASSIKKDKEFRCVRFECPANPAIRTKDFYIRTTAIQRKRRYCNAFVAVTETKTK